MQLIKKVCNLFSLKNRYNSDLENFILSNNPKDVSDVERLAKQYDAARKNNFY
jgi:hypothetical protein